MNERERSRDISDDELTERAAATAAANSSRRKCYLFPLFKTTCRFAVRHTDRDSFFLANSSILRRKPSYRRQLGLVFVF